MQGVWHLDLFMAALYNRAGHYIFALWFRSIYPSIFFPRLISAVADWMSIDYGSSKSFIFRAPGQYLETVSLQ